MSLRTLAQSRFIGRRGFATLLAFSVVIIASILMTFLQVSAYGQAAAGREALARVRAYWAARAGVEAAIASLEFNTQNPAEDDAFRVLDEMAAVAEGSFDGASYRVATFEGRNEVLGPSDAHARINVNAATTEQLLTLEPFMTEDVADSILDWIDADEDSRPLGAEAGYYQSLPYRYEPRNAPVRSLAELELIAGVYPEDLRGEDWNLNGVLDPNEDDGDLSWPPDNADGILDRGWSGLLTARSVEGTLGASGLVKLDLSSVDENDLVTRLEVSPQQAQVIVDYGARSGSNITDFLTRSLRQLAQTVGQSAQQAQAIEVLTDEQIGRLLEECTIGKPGLGVLQPGRLNINTCDAKILEDHLPQIPAELADAIVSDRSGRAQGYSSLAQLLEVQGMTRQRLATLVPLLTVRSTVYVVTSRGRDERTGVEVEVSATIDRSRLPVVITEMTVR